MLAQQINHIQETYDDITRAISEAIDADRTLVVESDRWLAHLIDESSIRDFRAYGEGISGHAEVYTVQTGGSTEYAYFNIPLDTLNEYL